MDYKSDQVWQLANKQIEREAWIRAMIAHYQAKISVYELMLQEWEEELRMQEAKEP
jgi:1,4-alpha-glucan branching enzyme